MEQDADGAALTIAPSGEGAAPFFSWSADTRQQTNEDVSDLPNARTLRAKYLVGCDGGRSLVRESMGIDRDGQDFD